MKTNQPVTIVEKKIDSLEQKMDKKFKEQDKRIDDKFERYEEKMDNRFKFFKDDILYSVQDAIKKSGNSLANLIDGVMTELQLMRSEQIGHYGQHDDLHSLPERMEKLESIHPHNQHQTI